MRLIYLSVIVPASILIPIIAGVWRYRQLPGSARLILAYLAVAGIVDVAASFMADRRINNMPLLHVYTVFEFIIILAFYYKLLTGKIRIVIKWMMAAFALLCVAYALFIGSIYQYNLLPRSTEGFIIGALAMIFFFRQLNADTKYPETALWINAGLLLYFSGSFLLFLFFEVLANNRTVNNLAWVLHATLVLLMYILCTIGFIRTRKQ